MATKTKKTAAERIRVMVRELDAMTAGELADAVLELASLGDALGRARVTSNWTREKERAKAAPVNEELTLKEFAEAVKVAAARVPASGRFGDNKVFISRVWNAANVDPLLNMRYAEFKRHLLEANQKRLLDLSRADLVEAMNRDDVRESETSFGAATFHFVRIG